MQVCNLFVYLYWKNNQILTTMNSQTLQIPKKKRINKYKLSNIFESLSILFLGLTVGAFILALLFFSIAYETAGIICTIFIAAFVILAFTSLAISNILI